MANLVISGVCNLQCSYCFAGDLISSQSRDPVRAFITPERFGEHLAFLQRSAIEQVRLIGGEPTLHPEFPRILKMAQAAQLPVLVFSNGLIPERALAALVQMPVDHLTVLVNMNTGHRGKPLSDKEIAHRRQVMEKLGSLVLPGYTILNPALDLTEIYQEIVLTGSKKALRLGLAQPVWNGGNRFLHPKQYRQTGLRIMTEAEIAHERGIKFEFDCGFVPCMFTEIELQQLRGFGTDIGWRCGPVLDIDLEGQAFHCFALSKFQRIPVQENSTALELREALVQNTTPYRAVGIFPECAVCPYKTSGACTGGCLSHTLHRYRKNPLRLEIPLEVI